MIAADSNILVRHLTQDDAVQSGKVRGLFDDSEARHEPVFLNHIVLCELCWVLKAVYGFDKSRIVLALEALLADDAFLVQERPLVEEAFEFYRKHSGQFSDHLIGVINEHEGGTTTYTFDRAAGKLPNFTLLK